MPRPTSLAFLALLLALLALVVGWVGLGGRSHVLWEREIEVRGRLVDASTGRSLGDVAVLAVRFESEVQEPKVLAAFALRTVAERESRSGGPAMDEWSNEGYGCDPALHVLTDGEGRFRVLARDRDCRAYGSFESIDPPSWPDRRGIHGLLIERPGSAPWVLAPPPHGTWTPRRPLASDGPDVVWDLGDIRVPPAPPEPPAALPSPPPSR